MAGHEKRIERAEQQAQRALAELGRELCLARLNHDLSQTTAGRAAGISHATWSRIERGAAPGLGVVDLARALTVVGLDLHVQAYPSGTPLREEAHVRLLERLHRQVGPGARWMTEVPLPKRGDRRAWDALVMIRGIRIGVEAETRARDSQELQRRLNLKRRDGGVDQVILLLANTRHNRAFLQAAGEGFHSEFTVEGRTALRHLAVPRDPGGSAIVLL